MARLIEMSAEDFAGFARFTLPLAKQGLVFIVGDNRDTEAASSNGACKSGLFKALGWCLYGQSLDGEPGDRVIRRGAKRARVSIAIEDGEHTYRVVRERWKQAPKLMLEKDGEAVSASKQDLQCAIDQLVGVDWEGFRNTVLYGQGDRDRFVYPTTRDAERKAILHRILGTGVFELCHAEAKKRRLAIEREHAAARAKVESLTSRIDDASASLGAHRVRAEHWAEEVEAKVKVLRGAARELAAQANEEGAEIDPVGLRQKRDKFEAKLATVRAGIVTGLDARKVWRERVREVAQRKAQLSAELRTHTDSLARLKGERCPVCTADLREGHAKAHKQALLAQGEELAAKLRHAERAELEAAQGERKAERELAESEGFQRRYTTKLAELKAELDQLGTAKARVRELADRAQEKLRDAQALRDSVNPHLALVDEESARRAALKRDRKEAKREVKRLTAELELLAFWVRGFGPSGIPSFALDAVMPVLTQRANHYLLTLAGGDIQVCFTAQRTLKGGELRDEIGIDWTVEGIEGYPPSGGQWKKIEIATNFALMDLVRTREGSHANILCLDECLDGLDDEGRQRVVELLQALRKERESIFLISHDPDLAEAFERTLIVIKEDGVSRLERAV